MAAAVYSVPQADIPADELEAARYLGYKRSAPPDAAVSAMIHDACARLHDVLRPQAVYDEYALSVSAEEGIAFADVRLRSVDLGRNLGGCGRVVLFAATVGAQVDAQIRRAQQFGAGAEAAVMQACGAMFAEAFVDMLNKKVAADAAARGMKAHPRYSPGYGDVPLSVQRDFFRLLPCGKIGLTLMDTLVMAPEKSVTAFVGLE
ncbi:MAG: hypothetical protein K2H09_05385 [Treponemataceae bacterium]|nr:hypothetical protein [Treponemataceae bacterium]